MTTTKWTKLISVRIDLKVLKRLETALMRQKELGYTDARISSLINDILDRGLPKD